MVWYTPAIPAMWEIDETLSKITKAKKRAGGRSSGTGPSWAQLQGPEPKPQYCQKKNT
jgi:hypothetical protein